MKNTQQSELWSRREQAVPRGPFHITQLTAARASGATLFDLNGDEYLDFAGGIGCVNAGHCPDEVVEAISDQARKLIHSCFHVVAYEPYVALSEKLNELTPGNFEKQTILLNSGAEAVENAVKIARCATGRPAVVCFEHAFHGRTLLGMTLTSKVMPYKYGFGPYAPEIYRVPFPYCYRCPVNQSPKDCDIACADVWDSFFKTHVAADQVAAVVIEPVLGEGGFVPVPKEYMVRLRQVCDRHGIVLIADEIQTGFCRTGRMFAMEHYGVAADLTITGKSIASGMPLAAVTGRKELMQAPHVGGLGGTYGGNPVCCRAALATIELYERLNLAARAESIGKTITERFLRLQRQHDCVGDVRGLGAMAGMEFIKSRADKEPAPEFLKQLLDRCLENGLILMSAGTFGNVLRMLMPLTVTDEELEKGLSIIESEMAR